MWKTWFNISARKISDKINGKQEASNFTCDWEKVKNVQEKYGKNGFRLRKLEWKMHQF